MKRACVTSMGLIEGLIAREKARGIPASRIVLMGFSQGCAMSLLAGLRHAERLAGLVGLSGYLPLAASTLAERSVANQRPAHLPGTREIRPDHSDRSRASPPAMRCWHWRIRSNGMNTRWSTRCAWRRSRTSTAGCFGRWRSPAEARSCRRGLGPRKRGSAPRCDPSWRWQPRRGRSQPISQAGEVDQHICCLVLDARKPFRPPENGFALRSATGTRPRVRRSPRPAPSQDSWASGIAPSRVPWRSRAGAA